MNEHVLANMSGPEYVYCSKNVLKSTVQGTTEGYYLNKHLTKEKAKSGMKGILRLKIG